VGWVVAMYVLPKVLHLLVRTSPLGGIAPRAWLCAALAGWLAGWLGGGEAGWVGSGWSSHTRHPND
jgi:hypothetical protein